MKLSDRALLVQFRITQWDGTKLDKRVSQEVADANGVNVKVGRYRKTLLPVGDALDALHSRAAEIRKKLKSNVLPWGDDHMYILPTANYLGFMTLYRAERSKWENMVTIFLADYQSMVAKAQVALGPLFNAKDYPSQNEIASKFSMELTVLPVPTTDFRTELASDELERIRHGVEKRVQEASASAMRELWDKLFFHVDKIAEKLKDPQSRLYDSMIENARETCALLGRLNFTDDPDLEAMRREVENSLTKYSTDVLRVDPDLRQETASRADEISAKMKAFMGV